MSATYRERVAAIYETYAPEKVGTVDTALQKYEGQEDMLISVLVNKYGPEPSASSPQTAPRHQPSQQQFQSPPQHQQQQQPADLQRFDSAFGMPAHSMVFSDDGVASVNRFNQQQQQQVPPTPPAELDPYQSVRAMIRDHGFVCREHERTWEEAWMGKMPLKTLRKDWEIEGTLLLDGMGQKLSSRARPVRRWQKRYFALVPPFFYYFEDDKAGSICKGALYMDRADIVETEQEGKAGKKILQITSRVSKKPTELDPNGSYSTFQICFDSARLQATWLAALQQVSQIELKPPTKHAAAAAGPGGAASPAPSFYQSSPMVYSSPPAISQQLPLQAPQAAATSPSTVPPAAQDASSPQQQDAPPAADAAPAPAAETTLNVPITTDDIRKRVDRLMNDRDPKEMMGLLLDFFGDQVTSANTWWKFMNQVEEVPTLREKKETEAQQQQQPSLQRTLDLTTPGRIVPPVPGPTMGGLDDAPAEVSAIDAAADTTNYASPLPPVSTSVPAAGTSSLSPAQYAALTSSAPLHHQVQHQQLHHAQQQPAGGDHNPQTVVDGSWQLRMDRLKARRSAVERILNDIPGSM